MMSSVTPLNPRIVPASPGRDTTRDPLANSIRSADSAVTGSGRPRALKWASTLRNNSPDWRSEGLRTSTSASGWRIAARIARAAAVVDLPTCRLHRRSTCSIVVPNTRCCHGSGAMLARVITRAGLSRRVVWNHSARSSTVSPHGTSL
jgi:hypothetical protein